MPLVCTKLLPIVSLGFPVEVVISKIPPETFKFPVRLMYEKAELVSLTIPLLILRLPAIFIVGDEVPLVRRKIPDDIIKFPPIVRVGVAGVMSAYFSCWLLVEVI